MRRVIEWFAVNHVAANLMMTLLLVGGAAAMFSIPIRAFPDIDVALVSIGVTYRGAAPEEIEESICVRIEEEIDGVEGIERVTSSATEGACGVLAELIQGVDSDRVLADIKNRVDGITTFPDDADKPIVSQPTLRRAVVDLALSGPIGERSLKELGKQLRDEIAQLPGCDEIGARPGVGRADEQNDCQQDVGCGEDERRPDRSPTGQSRDAGKRDDRSTPVHEPDGLTGTQEGAAGMDGQHPDERTVVH